MLVLFHNECLGVQEFVFQAAHLNFAGFQPIQKLLDGVADFRGELKQVAGPADALLVVLQGAVELLVVAFVD